MDESVNVLTEFSEQIERIAVKVETDFKGQDDGYNILDYLTKHHLEEFHTSFIGDLLNPKGKHRKGGVFLKAFAKVLLHKKDKSIGFSNLKKQLEDLDDEDYNTAKVEKEKPIDSTADANVYGRMDVFIRFPARKRSLVLENKIYSGEGMNQLWRYASYCRTSGDEFAILYLTLYGDTPKSSKGVDYVSVSYAEQIMEWLEMCLEIANDNHSIKAGLNFYKNMLQTKFFNSKYQCFMKSIAEFIVNQPDRSLLKYQVEIKDALTPVRNYYRDKFFAGVEHMLTGKGYEFELLNEQFGEVDIKDFWHKKNNGILFSGTDYVYQLEPSKTCQVLIEHDWNFLDYGFVVVSQEKDDCRRYSSDYSENAIVIEIREKLKTKLQDQKMWYTKQMFALQRFKPSDVNGTQLDFPDDRLNYVFAENMNGIVENFVENIVTYLNCFKDIIDHLKRN